MSILNVDLSFMAEALKGKGINAKPKAIHKIGISRRKKQVEIKIKEIDESLTPDKDYKKFIDELENLKKQYADTDDKGKMIERDIPTQSGQIVKVPLVNKRLDDYMKAVVILREKHSATIKSAKALNDSYEDLLTSKSDIKLAPVLMSDFVQEFTSYKELFGIYPIIKDFDKEKCLKKKTKLKLKVVDIIGNDNDNSSGLADVSKMNVFNDIKLWDLAVVLAFNMRVVRSKAFALKDNKIAVDYKNIHEMSRIALCDDSAKKNINGEPMKNENGYIIENVIKFNSEFDKLKIKNKKVIDAYDKFLESEVEIEVVLIGEDLIAAMDAELASEDLDISQDQAGILDYFV